MCSRKRSEIHITTYCAAIRRRVEIAFDRYTVSIATGKSEHIAGLAGPLAVNICCCTAACLLVLNLVLTNPLRIFKECLVILNVITKQGFLIANFACILVNS